jgi:predicted nucleotidyltransferase
MLATQIIATTNQKVLSFLVKYSDREFYERRIAVQTGVSYGSANRALHELHSSGLVKRHREGRMLFYSINTGNPAVVHYKKLVNLILIEPLIERLKTVADRVILYGSCAQGNDNSRSDIDLFVVAMDTDRAKEMVSSYVLPRGFQDIHVSPVFKTPAEVLEAGDSQRVFLEEIERGIVLWEKRP